MRADQEPSQEVRQPKVTSLKLEYGHEVITRSSQCNRLLSLQKSSAVGDIDDGVALFGAEDIDGTCTLETTYPGFIPFPSAVTQDAYGMT